MQGVLLLVALFSGKHTFPAGKLFALVCNPLTVLAFLAIVARSMPVDQSNALLMVCARCKTVRALEDVSEGKGSDERRELRRRARPVDCLQACARCDMVEM